MPKATSNTGNLAPLTVKMPRSQKPLVPSRSALRPVRVESARLAGLYENHVSPRLTVSRTLEAIAQTAAVLLLTACQTVSPGANQREPSDRPPVSPVSASVPFSEATNPPPALRIVSPGILALGNVRLNQAEQTVTFPAVLNRASGGMEYFLVTPYGKVHESILRTQVTPMQIHLAMLLLSAKGTTGDPPASRPNQYGGTPGSLISGEFVSIEVAWRNDGQERSYSAEEMLANPGDALPSAKRRWVFNGSMVWKGAFLAQESGSVISLIPDPIALINLIAPAPGGGGVWMAVADKVPPENVPVQVTIRLTGVRTDR